MVRKVSLLVTGFSAAILAVVPPASAQQSAPRIRLATVPTAAANTISPRVSLNDPAYILAVAIDRDGRAQVLSPVTPSDAIQFEPAKSIHLPSFFGGFASARYAGYGSLNYNSGGFGFMDYEAGTALRGSVLVIASRTPFNFAAISDGVYWDEEAIRQLIRYRMPASAVTALGRAVSEKGHSFGYDYMYLGTRASSRFASSAFGNINSSCIVDYWYSPDGYSTFASYGAVTRLYARQAGGFVLLDAGTDTCGRVRYIRLPYQQIPPRGPKPDSVRPDTVQKDQPQFRSASTGSYSGDDARRVLEILKSGHSSEALKGISNNPILVDKEDGPGRPGNRNTSHDRVESSLDRTGGASATPIERAPVVRQDPPREYRMPVVQQPIIRNEPVMRSAPSFPRESKPTGVSPGVKDNE